MLSLKDAWSTRHSGLPLSQGLTTQFHPFYSNVPERRRVFPYGSQGDEVSNGDGGPHISVRSLIGGLEWPGSFVPTRSGSHDYPKDRKTGWSEKLNGVTHDDRHWYFAQVDRLLKIPVTHDLNDRVSGSAFLTAGLPSGGYDHFGDIDFYQGLLYVAAENQTIGLPAAVFIYDQNLRELGHAKLSAQETSGPWCAVNPRNGLLYSSCFNNEPHLPVVLQVYEPEVIRDAAKTIVGLGLTHLGAMPLYDERGEVLHSDGLQGAVFSRRGHLYLVADSFSEHGPDDVSRYGVMGFDMITGRRVLHLPVDYHPWMHVPGEGWVHDQELEGITIWEEAQSLGAPGISGQLHLIMVSVDLDEIPLVKVRLGPLGWDDLYFKHYEVENAEDIVKI